MAAEQKIPTQEREARVMSGWTMLPITIALYVAGPVLIALAFINGTSNGTGGTDPVWALFVGGIVALGVAILLTPGFFTLQPNEARVLVLFGSYKGSCKQGGFCWGNPFYANGPTGQTGGQSQLDAGARTRATATRRRPAPRSSSATRSACAPAP